MKVLITGGAGFIGCNLAHHLIDKGNDVIIYDNLSRCGSQANLQWLSDKFGNKFIFIHGDVRDAVKLLETAKDVNAIYHLAAQVAVTTSVKDPREDFEINALGTFNALEAARLSNSSPIFFYASTNKIYGGMEETKVGETETRYIFPDLTLGVPETYPLDFHSPYGCSKGAGDQYTRDYYRIYGVRTIVFRQSCIYGWRQFGVEDQGWLAHFAISAVKGRDVTIYGDGKQVRDILFIDDLIRAIELAVENIEVTAGQIYNIGGGPNNTLSVWAEAGPMLEALNGKPIPVRWEDWRPGDQRIYISDIRKAERDFGWTPQISPENGLKKIWDWIKVTNIDLFP
jgi:CDP-paratose 2-epimerase